VTQVDHPRPAFRTATSLNFEGTMGPFRHSTGVSSKAYADFTLPHPLLRTRSPFALPARDYTPSTERTAQVYSARAVTYDADGGSHTGPEFAVHSKGWGLPCRGLVIKGEQARDPPPRP